MDVKVNTKSNLNFRAGLNTSLRFRELCLNSSRQENRFNRLYGTEAHFGQNKAVALANTLCAQIFEDIGRRFNIELAAPPAITVYHPSQLAQQGRYINFCISDTAKVLKNEAVYPAGSLFFKDYKDLKTIDNLTEELYADKKISSNHFLAMYIHEWLHSIHLDYIFKKFGYPGDCKFLKELYPLPKTPPKFKSIEELQQKCLNEEETAIVREHLSDFAGEKEHQYFEVFGEIFTKLICSSLSKDCTHVTKNPLELLNQSCPELQKIVRKVTNMD